MPADSLVFVDTSVLISADDSFDPDRQAQIRQWLLYLWQRRAGRLSIEVLNEYYILVTKPDRPGLTQGDARAKVRRFQVWKPWQIDHQTVETAWGVEARFGLSYRDSLIVAAAQHAGCSHVLSLVLPHGQQYGAVQVVSPFIVSFESLHESS